MPDANLVELARQYVDLTSQLESVRNQMHLALANGADPSPVRPTRPPASGGVTSKAKPHKSSRRAAALSRAARSARAKPGRAEVLAQAALADEAVLALVRGQPGVKTGEIARSTQAKSTTTIERLRRLREKGLVTGGRSDGWTASPA